MLRQCCMQVMCLARAAAKPQRSLFRCCDLSAHWSDAAAGAKRPAGAALNAAVQAHNLALVLLSSWMSVSACAEAWRLGYRFWGTAYSDAEGGMATVVYVFYVSKLYEFVDTVRTA